MAEPHKSSAKMIGATSTPFVSALTSKPQRSQHIVADYTPIAPHKVSMEPDDSGYFTSPPLPPPGLFFATSDFSSASHDSVDYISSSSSSGPNTTHNDYNFDQSMTSDAYFSSSSGFYDSDFTSDRKYQQDDCRKSIDDARRVLNFASSDQIQSSSGATSACDNVSSLSQGCDSRYTGVRPKTRLSRTAATNRLSLMPSTDMSNATIDSSSSPVDIPSHINDSGLSITPAKRSTRPALTPEKLAAVEKFLSGFLSTPPNLIIGRKMGLSRVDFITELSVYRNCSPITSRILRYLDDRDLTCMCCVSRQWYKTCHRDVQTNTRRLDYLRQNRVKRVQLGKENEKCKESDRKLTSGAFGVFKLLQTVEMPSGENKVPPIADSTPSQKREFIPDHNSRHLWFMQEAQKLHGDEHLDVCPRCSSPSTVTKETDCGRCNRTTCHYEFCTRCRCGYHTGLQCIIGTPKKQRPTNAGSKMSKKNLRRL